MATSPKRLALASQNNQKTTASDLKLVLFPNLPSSPAEYSVRALEERFSKAFHANPQPMSISTLDEGMYIDVNESFLNILGYEREDVIGHTSLELGIWTTPQDRKRFVASLSKDGRVRDVETTIHGNSGDVRIWLSSAELIELNGHDCILIASTDITERKQADEKLRDLSGRLIRAQEEERSRIARELHDDLNQQLAVLAVEIDHLKQNPPRHLKTFRSKVSALGKRTQEISAVVHHLSYQLHPSRLDYLGLVAALRALCMDVSASSGIRIEFTEFKVPQVVPSELSLCFYRVAQEALRNVVRHSGATSACCELSYRNGSLSLRIMDSGSGFDVDKAQSNRGLGLISMEERLRLVDGELRINSQPLRGTLIEARAPLSSDSLLRRSKS